MKNRDDPEGMNCPDWIRQVNLGVEKEIRRNKEALARKELRLSEKKKESDCQLDKSKC